MCWSAVKSEPSRTAPHRLGEPMIGEGPAALKHHVFVQVESVDQLRRGSGFFRQSREAFSKRPILEQ
jgi:hypothetical protein